MEISDLPAEMLLQIHQWLPLPALKEAVLVCQLWRKVGEDPSLWKWCKVTVYKKDHIGNLAIRRIKNIQEIKINPQNWDAEDWEAFFLATMELLRLKMIDGLVDRGLGARGTVEKGVFARALAKLEVVELCQTPYDQIEQLFTEMSWSTKIKKLQLVFHDLSLMNPDLFAMVLSRLEDVRLIDNNATKEQMRALFKQISDQNYLKKIDLDEGSVTHLEPGLFARALARVEEVMLFHEDDDDEKSDDEGDGDDRTKRQIEALFTELDHGTQLKKLELDSFDLSEVASRKFARALSRLETVGLDCCNVTNDQMEELFTQMSDNTRTKKLSLMCVDLSLVELGLLAGVLVKMDDVDLSYCLLNPLQIEAFFTEASHSTHLKKLDINNVDLSSVEPEVFAQAVNRLEEVTLEGPLEGNSLTDDQSQSLFTQMALNTKLKELDIDMSNISAVCPQTLAIALNKLDTVKLNRTHLTRDQAEAFFIELARETSLKKLTMFDTDLSSLDPDILGTALAKLKEATLGGTRLAQEKIEVVLTHVLEEDCKLRKLRWTLEDGPLEGPDGLNPETVRKVRDKLKGELSLR